MFSQGCLDPLDSVIYENGIATAHLSVDYRANNTNREIADIPIIFVYARNAEGELGESSLSDEAELDTWIQNSISVANELYGDEFNLFQLGDVIYIDHDQIHNITTSFIGFVYITNTIVVSVMPAKGNSYSSASFPIHHITPGSENEPDNEVLMGPRFFDPSKRPDELAHEIGHVFNLYHIFQPYSYWDMSQNKNVYITELVIRELDNNKPNPNPNWNTRGDFVKDTDADCLVNHPAWTNCNWGSKYCTITDDNKFKYNGTFADLNADNLINHDLRERNIMGYYLCRDLVTSGQLDRIAQISDSYRRDQLNASAYDLEDYIEFEGTTKKLKNILTIFNFPSIGNYSNLRTATHRYTTNSSGKIETVLLDDVIKAHVIFGGKNVDVGAPGFYKSYLPAVYSEWKDSLDISDIIAIQKAIGQFGQNTLATGYKRLAADVNDDGTISTADVTLIQDLLLGKITKFPAFDQPWRFVPEYISQGSFGFLNNPFNRTIDGNFVPKADYTKPDFSFEITDGFDGKAGFDGVKIGNTTHSEYMAHPGMSLTNGTSSPSLLADTSYHVTLSIKSNSFNATQLKLFHQNGVIDDESFTCNLAIDSFSLNNIHYSSEESTTAIVWSLPEITLDSTYFITFEFVPSLSSSDMSDYFYFDNELFENLIIDTSGIAVSGTVHLIINNSEEGELRSSESKRIDEKLSLITLSPNPTNDQLLVQVNFSGNLLSEMAYTLDVMDAKGANYYKTKGIFVLQNNELNLPVHNLQNGMYYLRLNIEGQSNTLPFTKQ